MAKNTLSNVKQTQREQYPPNFDGVFTERFLLPREVKKMCGIRHFRKTGMGSLKHLRRLRRFSPIYLHNSVPFRGRCTRLAQKRLHALKLGAVRYLRDYSKALM